MAKTRISYSSVNTFKQCPTKYYHSKKYRMKLQASAFAFGAAVEDGVDVLLQGGTFAQAAKKFKDSWKVRPANRWEDARPVLDSEDIFYYNSDYDSKLLTKTDQTLLRTWWAERFDIGLEDPIKMADTYQAKIKGGEQLEEGERWFYHRVLWMCCRRRGLYMLQAFERDILPEITDVIAIQKEISMTNADGDQTMGFIDYVLKIKGIEEKIIFDLKTSGKYYEEHDLDTSDQLRIYSAAEDTPRIGYLVLHKNIKHSASCDSCGTPRAKGSRKVNCETCGKGKYKAYTHEGTTQILTKKLTKSEIDDVLHDFSDVLAAIKNEVRWKNPSSCHNFGTRCEFYDVCWGGKKLEELEHLKKK